jgi:hypothetical protein
MAGDLVDVGLCFLSFPISPGFTQLLLLEYRIFADGGMCKYNANFKVDFAVYGAESLRLNINKFVRKIMQNG